MNPAFDILPISMIDDDYASHMEEALEMDVPEEPMPISRCDYCGDAGTILDNGSERDCPECGR